MKGKLKIVVPLALLIVLGGLYKVVLAKPSNVKHKVDGVVYILPKEFMLNLADDHFAKLNVALVLPPVFTLIFGHAFENPASSDVPALIQNGDSGSERTQRTLAETVGLLNADQRRVVAERMAGEDYRGARWKAARATTSSSAQAATTC